MGIKPQRRFLLKLPVCSLLPQAQDEAKHRTAGIPSAMLCEEQSYSRGLAGRGKCLLSLQRFPQGSDFSDLKEKW